MNGEFIEETLIYDELASGASYVHEFTTPLDFSAIGEYTIEAYVTHPDDLVVGNNTISETVRQLLAVDAELVNVSNTVDNCTSEIPVSAVLFNRGFEVIENAEIQFSVNGTVQTTLDWTGNILTDDSAVFSSNVTLSSGENEIQIEVVSVNGSADQNPDNNLAEGNATFSPDLISFTLQIQTDQYPEESRWTITNSDTNEEVASGGPFSQDFELVTQEICLEEDVCYVFTLTDQYGDGISGGSYSMSLNGTEVFGGAGLSFSSEVTHAFCGDGTIPDVNSVSELTEEQFNLVISPNPNEGYFHVTLATEYLAAEQIEMKIYESNGKLIQKRSIGKYDGVYTTSVSLVEYASGTYIVKFSDQRKTISQRVVKL